MSRTNHCAGTRGRVAVPPWSAVLSCCCYCVVCTDGSSSAWSPTSPQPSRVLKFSLVFNSLSAHSLFSGAGFPVYVYVDSFLWEREFSLSQEALVGTPVSGLPVGTGLLPEHCCPRCAAVVAVFLTVAGRFLGLPLPGHGLFLSSQEPCGCPRPSLLSWFADSSATFCYAAAAACFSLVLENAHPMWHFLSLCPRCLTP